MTTAATAPMAAIRTNRRRRATPRIGRQPTSHASRIRQGSGADADGLPFGDVRVAVPGPIASAHDEEPPGVRGERRRLKRCRARTRRVGRAPRSSRRRTSSTRRRRTRWRPPATRRHAPPPTGGSTGSSGHGRSAPERRTSPAQSRRSEAVSGRVRRRGLSRHGSCSARSSRARGRSRRHRLSVGTCRAGWSSGCQAFSSHARWRLARAVALDGPRSSSIPRSRRPLKPAPQRHRRSARCQLRAPKFCTRRR